MGEVVPLAVGTEGLPSSTLLHAGHSRPNENHRMLDLGKCREHPAQLLYGPGKEAEHREGKILSQVTQQGGSRAGARSPVSLSTVQCHCGLKFRGGFHLVPLYKHKKRWKEEG